MTVRVVAVVSGHVQGVGYRWFVRELANAAGLAGSATNLPDGGVEVVVEGPEDDVAALVDALDGPRAPGGGDPGRPALGSGAGHQRVHHSVMNTTLLRHGE